MQYSLREKMGALMYDVPRTLLALLPAFLFSSSRHPWLVIKNRNEHLIPDKNGEGYRCDWKWTSDLYLPKVFPLFGRLLYQRAFNDFPIVMQDEPEWVSNEKLEVSFIIGHRGLERLPLLLATLKSIAGQQDCRFECIVVEQDNVSRVKDELPGWVRYIHTPLPEENMPYSRSWAFNVGAAAARSDVLVLHDNDMLVPSIYAFEVLKHYRSGDEVVNLKRFIFYLDEKTTKQVCDSNELSSSNTVTNIMQNAEGGGSLGVSKSAYFTIGGFDERFIGWGGEDNEFWERAQTRKVHPYGYLPIIHLWHPAQPQKQDPDAKGVSLYKQLANQSVESRIKFLKKNIE